MNSSDLYNSALIANGVIEDYSCISSLMKNYSYYVAVDGGLMHCEKMAITPDLIIGDLDSVLPNTLSRYKDIPTLRYPIEKDETDLELAILNVLEHSKKITLFGALGNRTDHSLYNLHLLRRYPKKVFIETEHETIFAITNKTILSTKEGQTISFIPLGKASDITSIGLKWELKNAIFEKNFMSISNICLGDEVEVDVREGDLICCLQKM
jgi:thiamine pyrophosphokinase